MVTFANISVGTLPEPVWDRMMVLKDVVVDGFTNSSKNLDEVYVLLRREFCRDTGMQDIIPDFIRDCDSLTGVYRYLNRMNVCVDEQIEHVHETFDPLTDYMELVFRPRSTEYEPNYWPSKPKVTPFAPIAGIDELEVPARFNSGVQEFRENYQVQANRVLALAPLALSGLEQLAVQLENLRLHNNPPQPLFGEEVDALLRLHREIGELLRLVRDGQPIEEKLSLARKVMAMTFQFARDTGELIVTGLPPLTASALPAWGTLKLCETLLGMSVEASATMAAGVIAGSFALQLKPKKDV